MSTVRSGFVPEAGGLALNVVQHRSIHYDRDRAWIEGGIYMELHDHSSVIECNYDDRMLFAASRMQPCAMNK